MYLIENLSSIEYHTDEGLLIESYIADMAAGNTGAVEWLYIKTKSSVYGYSMSILKNRADAEDVLQDTYIQIYRSAGRYKPNGNPMPWVLTIVRNLCLMKLRQRRRAVDMPEEIWQSIPDGEFAADADDRISLNSAMMSLNEQERTIITLHATSGIKHREIASLLGLPLPTVLSKYNRAIKKLQKLLGE